VLTLKMAWRSFVRHRRRSAITVCAVAVSLAMMLIFVGMADDGHARMAEMGIRLGAGHVLVQGKGYQHSESLDYLVPDPGPVLHLAGTLPEVAHAVPRVRATGLLSAGDRSAPVLVSGVDPEKEPLVSSLPDRRRIVAGAYLRPRDRMPLKNAPADIYIGQELARTLELGVGDRVVLTLSPRGASRPSSAAFQVRGIFRTGVDELDQSWVEAPIDEVRRLLRLGTGVTQVALLLNDLRQTARVTEALRARLDPGTLEVVPWDVALRELHDAIAMDNAGMYLMMAIIFVLVAIGIFNTVFMSVVERTREFGVMMALGCTGRRLAATVLVEGVILALVSAALGLALGLALHLWVASTGIDMGHWAKDYQIAGIVLEGYMYSRLSVPVVVKWTLVVVGIVILSTIYPALRAARLRPLEAIHHV